MSKTWSDPQPDPEVRAHLDALREVPPRDPTAAARARTAFLAEARRLAVSESSPRRLNQWKAFWIGLTHPRKEVSPMFSALTTILLVVSLLLGGSGITVAAAQSSLPEDWLYPVKTWSEDLRSELTRTPQARINLNLELAERRTAEISQMLDREEVPPEPVLQRLQTHLQTALQLAAAQNDAQAIQALERIRQRLEVQYQRLMQQANISNPTARAVLQRTRAMIQTHLQAVQEGLQDPELLRQRLRQGMPEEMPPTRRQPGGNPWTEDTPTPGSGYGSGQGGNPWTQDTPTPGSGYGSGQGGNPWTQDTPTPGSGYGSGQGGNPWTQDTPTPGSGYGPGPGPEATCTPAGGPMMPTAQPPRHGNSPARP
ncbi:hypothetical protein SE15_01055 [Thermanaerothrix daxensis]|uniref:DUF5667 domain-containing protein n=1 Tax=Thermanaerothrix daxensis TaxID=869279 RepID=A0A0P6Y3A4_9CHLR|nr:DUF5667 domain-containing protein [Thermanaerothrix daxensis]KPL83859.1 hypothetical protein SE15_01055 [Thermanaerothrix daxensis]